jgi:ATP-dependent Clp protease ATP-binding subunit ClpA
MSQGEMFEKFNKDVGNMIIYAKAASINAKIDCIYSESLFIGILTMGTNNVKTCLLSQQNNLDELVGTLKEKLKEKAKNNTSKIGFDDLSISKKVIEICNESLTICKSQNKKIIDLSHIFLAILKKDIEINKILGSCDFDVHQLISDVKKNKKNEKKKPQNKQNESALEFFCRNITTLAYENKLDPIIGREEEIEEAITILCRKKKRNPMLIGLPGVGKTAIAEGIAQRIISQTVPDKLKKASIYELNLSSLVAGTKYRGEFENRLQALIDEVEQDENKILFVDEVHTIAGAGSASGGGLDASNILKPSLARGLRCIGATTDYDYKKYLSNDGALERRFEKVQIEEPDEDKTKMILLGLKTSMEDYHNCIITDDAINMSIKLAKRYLTNKNFPDKSISLLDTACAKYAWDNSSSKPSVSKNDIAMVISKECKIPIETILWDNFEKIKQVEQILLKNIVGQNHAVNSICKVLKSAYSGVRNPDKPIGIFVLGGPSGVGKTYTAKQLAEALNFSLVKLDMSEYSEKHSISKIIGSPPGYVGFQESSVEIDKIKRRPYSIILLDEMEKAHPDVLKIFLQVMSEGVLTDANGDQVNFKNCVLIFTGNFGMNENKQNSLGFGEGLNKSEQEYGKERLISFFKQNYQAEFVNRIDDFIPYNNLNDDIIRKIIENNLKDFKNRIYRDNITIKFNKTVVDFLMEERSKEHGMNAMVIDRLISKHIEPVVADTLIHIDNEKKYNVSFSKTKNGDIKSNVKSVKR